MQRNSRQDWISLTIGSIFYEEDALYKTKREDLLVKVSSFLEQVDTTNAQSITSSCQQLWKELDAMTEYVDKAFVYLHAIENLMNYAAKAALFSATDASAFDYIERCLNRAGEYLREEIHRQRNLHYAPHRLGYDQLKSDLQYLRLYLEFQTRIGAYHTSSKAILELFGNVSLSEQERRFLLTPAEDRDQALLYAAVYLNIDFDELFDARCDKSTLVEKHRKTLIKKGKLQSDTEWEETLLEVYNYYNMSKPREYTPEYNRFAASANLVLALREQLGLSMSLELPATWVVVQ